MNYEIELFCERVDAHEDKIWQVINYYCHRYLGHGGDVISDSFPVHDIRTISEMALNYEGIPLGIDFTKNGNKLMWFGNTYTSQGSIGRHEHILGYIEIRHISLNKPTPVEVRVVCMWKPFLAFFIGLADAMRVSFTQQPIDVARKEIIGFKLLVERQLHKDIFINGKPQENLARSNLQAYLQGRSYREVLVRGGRTGILVFDKLSRFLYETKIWRGISYHNQGLREIGEYIIGEDDDGKLRGIFYLVFDPTKSSSARRFLGSDFSQEAIMGRSVDIIIVNLYPPPPSKKK